MEAMKLLAEAHPLVFSATALLLTIYTLKLFIGRSANKSSYPPIAGTIFHLLFNIHRPLDFLTDISRRHKTFRLLTPFYNYVYTVDPANVEFILKTNFANYGKGDMTYDIAKDLLGDGIFAVDGEKWHHQRKMASFEFSTKVLRDYSSIVFKKNGTRLAQIVSEAAGSNQMINIQDLFMKSTLDSIFKVGFGVELETLSGSNREGQDFAKAFDESSSQLLLRFLDVSWKVKRYLNIGSEATMKNNVRLIDDFVYKVIRKRIQQLSEQQDGTAKKSDILSRFLLERESDPEKMSFKYLRDIILNFVIAGRDTTAGTLSWFFYMMCKNPDVQEKVAQEVRDATRASGEMPPICEYAAMLTEEAMNAMTYLHAALTETLRLYPAVPVDAKACFSDDTLPDGYKVRKGDMVNYQPYQMGRMKFLWGENAEDFRPERWFNDDGVFVPESPFKFTAFQAGPRICLGKEFAYRQMKIFAAILLCFFRFKMWDETKDVKCGVMLTLQVEDGLYLSAVTR